jgi:hypothetical protein
MTIAASFAELEREKISERTRDAKRYLSSQGVSLAARAPSATTLSRMATSSAWCRTRPSRPWSIA